jgi:hypothetical protein
MIAVRRIDTTPPPYCLDFRILFKWNTKEYNFNIICEIPSSYTLLEACSAIRTEFRRHCSFQEDTSVNEVEIIFKRETSEHLLFGLCKDCETDPWIPWTITRNETPDHLKFQGSQDDFLKLFNYQGDPDNFYHAQFPRLYTFENVRSREKGDLFLHASFVSNTTSGYLGRGSEFYPKPSKMYFENGASFFYIETSLDGLHRIRLPECKFILELSFIMESED